MSLLDDFEESCVLIEKKRVPDGEGGFTTTWENGADFLASIILNNSMEALAAEKQGLTSVYTVITSKNTLLEYHDVFRRASDGKTFRVTSDATDKQAPKSAGLQLAQVTAEKWELTQ